MRKALLLLLVGCAGNAASKGADDSPGGNNVSFGGAQDIGQFRDILDSGGLPGPDTLDANGFFNEHYNAPPPADCGHTLCMVPGLSVGRDWLTGAHQATLQLSISTPVDPSTYHRMPMNLVLVIDRSGSMAQDGRLTKVKTGLDALIDNLAEGDRLSIIDFDDRVTVDAPLSAALDRAHLHAIVAALQPRGGTDIDAGLRAGFQQLGDAPASDHQNRVILLSDGLATSGETDDSAIIFDADVAISKGIGLTTIGVGHDFDVALMRGLAEHGAGNFYFLEDGSAATEVFTEELDYFLTPLALDVQVTALAGPGYDFGEVIGSHLWTADRRQGFMTLPAVFLASRTSQTGEVGRRGGGSQIFIRVDPKGHDGGNVGVFDLTYHLPGSTEQITQHVELAYSGDPEVTPEMTYLSAPEMAERYAVYNMFLGFRFATLQPNLNCASTGLAATRAAAVTWNAEKHDPDIAADLDLLDTYTANLRANGGGAVSTLTTCGGTNPTDPTSNPYPGNDYNDNPNHVGCMSVGAPSGFGMMAFALAFALRRRRR